MCVLFDLGRILLTVFYVYTHCAAVYLARKDPTCQMPVPGQCPAAVIAQPKKAAHPVPPLLAAAGTGGFAPGAAACEADCGASVDGGVATTGRLTATLAGCRKGV